ncbi:Na(+)/H(+) antiporter subunit F1 [Lacicoccus alkaliphilus]|uniref:Multisubunit sodium/proton antiporter, MrpF subunit (TC 2.A.63.1) n=1 Tax=Lacicoccus alkaliphilus DSM 16010 TaxID=1123231 RepID=A0A1M7FKM8_9BACL|nr:Na(+)/H(+) antiporter subunit F1 [Salinicoccus alkaliphilus]SHM04249.1 multisubunit sodium/proton antiporter, MrpF subunit (TC 2.A.63.1) [Salinicoccus alkaliphilus DSM 16010]
MTSFLEVVILISGIILALSLVGIAYRIIVGPTLHDKIVALDAFGVMLMGMIALTAITLGSVHYVPIILLIGTLAFLSTITFAKYLERNVIIDDDRDNDE